MELLTPLAFLEPRLDAAKVKLGTGSAPPADVRRDLNVLEASSETP